RAAVRGATFGRAREPDRYRRRLSKTEMVIIFAIKKTGADRVTGTGPEGLQAIQRDRSWLVDWGIAGRLHFGRRVPGSVARHHAVAVLDRCCARPDVRRISPVRVNADQSTGPRSRPCRAQAGIPARATQARHSQRQPRTMMEETASRGFSCVKGSARG